MASPFKVLISGAGITGPVLAFWLARASTARRPIHITMIERASGLVKLGQGIEIEGPSRVIADRMGLMDVIRTHTTNEKGFRCIDKNNNVRATFEMGGMTQELEIMRGVLCQILTDAIKDKTNVKLEYNRRIRSIHNQEHCVNVQMVQKDGTNYEETYDAVIGSDGLWSETRDRILALEETKQCLKPRNVFIAYCSIPAQPQDCDYSRLQHSLGGRAVIIRPVTKEVSSVYLMAVGNHPTLERSLGDRNRRVSRQDWIDAFSDVRHGEFPRVLEAIQETENFYADQITQVKLPTWYSRRCALVGDAAWAPTVITGQGTQLAFLGAYVLAGELANNLDDPAAAFASYEDKLRDYITRAQTVPLGGRAPQIMVPQTAAGIWLLQSFFWLIAKSRISEWGANLFPADEVFPIEDYQFGHYRFGELQDKAQV